MAMDGVMLAAVRHELAKDLTGARVERIHMPQADTLTLRLYHGTRGDCLLLVRAHGRFGRIHRSTRRFENPAAPPDFCMALRKHLEGARLAAFRQDGLDRRLAVAFTRNGETRLSLVCELFGSAANILLLDDTETVLAVLRPLPPGRGARTLLPGARYQAPAPSGKLDLTIAECDVIAGRLAEAFAAGEDAADPLPRWRRLLRICEGIGPDLSRELILQAGLDPEDAGPLTADAMQRLLAALQSLRDRLQSTTFAPSALYDAAGRIRAIAAVPLTHLAAARSWRVESAQSASALADRAYARWETDAARQQQKERLERRIAAQVERTRRTLHARQADLGKADDAETYRRWGELLLAQLHAVPHGADRATVVDYFDPAQPATTIPLDPSRSPQANAERYFRLARRLDRTRVTAQRLVAETEQHLRYLESLLLAAQLADDEDVMADIEREFEAWLHRHDARGDAADQPARRAAAKGSKKAAAARRSREARQNADRPPQRSGRLRFRSRDGWTLWVGRSNTENERLTFQLARDDDWWFHVRGDRGAHVIARAESGDATSEPPPATITEAAVLAAAYSRARDGQNVAVDYTRVRHVRKQRGALPGMVTYSNQRTVFVTPADGPWPERVEGNDARAQTP